jgi:hypothetical protein
MEDKVRLVLSILILKLNFNNNLKSISLGEAMMHHLLNVMGLSRSTMTQLGSVESRIRLKLLRRGLLRDGGNYLN